MPDESSMPDETAELVGELARAWTEVYKKSATTLVLLRLIDESQMGSVNELRARFQEKTGWAITERGLYRTLRRLAQQGVLHTTESVAPRTVARRKTFTLTDVGTAFRRQIETQMLSSNRTERG